MPLAALGRTLDGQERLKEWGLCVAKGPRGYVMSQCVIQYQLYFVLRTCSIDKVTEVDICYLYMYFLPQHRPQSG